MSSSLARPLMRRSMKLPNTTARTVARRFESSTTAKATEATKEKAADFKTKASEGLSRVQSAAGPAISGAVSSAGNALGKVGGRTGRLIGFVQRQIPLVVYYSKVGLEVGKIVFQGQKMSPPSVSTFQSYFNRALSAVKNPGTLMESASSTASSAAAQPETMANRVKNVSNAQLVGGGVLVAELLGFFTVGEMIGRFKLIGYHGETESHH